MDEKAFNQKNHGSCKFIKFSEYQNNLQEIGKNVRFIVNPRLKQNKNSTTEVTFEGSSRIWSALDVNSNPPSHPASQPFLTKCSFSFKVHVHQTRKILYFGSFSVQTIIAKNFFFAQKLNFVCQFAGKLVQQILTLYYFCNQ